MTVHINEKCTLLSNAQKVKKQAPEIPTQFNDGDFLRLFCDNFDTVITGKVIYCDIEIYNIYEDDNEPNVIEVDLVVMSLSVFYRIKYRTNLDWFVDAEVEKYIHEDIIEYAPEKI